MNTKLVSKKDKNHSYFSVGKGRRNKNLIMIILPIAIVVIITSLLLSSMSGVSPSNNKMLLHNHVTFNVTYNDKTQLVPQNIGLQSTRCCMETIL